MNPSMTSSRLLSSRAVSLARRLTVSRSLATNASVSSDGIHDRWSQTLSFAQAESDFSASDRHYAPPQWSHTMNYASPESDFSASDRFVSADDNVATRTLKTWSGALSFASPESDFVSAPMTALGVIHKGEMLQETNPDKKLFAGHDSSLSSKDLVEAPETALGVVHAAKFETSSRRPRVVAAFDLSQPLWSSPESASGSVSILEMLTDNLKKELLAHTAAKDALPHTVAEAMEDDRPIVITSAKAPFQVYDVNAAWEGLCGYTREEARNQTIAKLLQGPSTDNRTAREMIEYLQRTGYSEAVLTNYKKNGDSFTNHIQVGVVQDESTDDGSPELFFVGILEEIGETMGASSRNQMSA